MSERKQSGDQLSPFEKKLLSRVRAANHRLASVESIDELRPQLTMRRVKLDLAPRPISGEEVKMVRSALGVSQGVFAAFIQVSVRSLQNWEQGRKEVPGCPARLIGEMLRDPNYWTKRLQDAVEMADSI